MEILPYHQAVEQGLTFYYTNKPCSKGHLSKRRVSSRTCNECHNICLKNNPEPRRASAKRHYRANKKARKAYIYDYIREHRNLYNAHSAKRRAIRLQACPRWIDLSVIKLFYEACPKDKHVDHIIPLKNKIVCGLHILRNLQYLKPSENYAKHNNFTPYVEKPCGSRVYI